MEFSSEQKSSPRREVQLQGPRPTPLKVSKDSRKIRKPPVAPSHPPNPQPHPPHAPVIIYAVSPKVIHTDPGDFMSLVQRLTGPSPTYRHPPAAAAAAAAVAFSPGPVSPAARLAVIERSCVPPDAHRNAAATPAAAAALYDCDLAEHLDTDIAAAFDAINQLPGILSPVPSALPAISPGIFSPLPEVGSMAFLNEMSPVFRGNRGFAENPFLPSPGNLLLTPTLPSPGALWDLLRQL